MLIYILFGCSPLGTKDLDLSLVDKDGDFFTPEDGDCDDTRADTFPGAAKNDSNELCMRDSDGDGYGDLTPDNPAVNPGRDCNDEDPEINPSIEEIPSNGVDQDCDNLELCYQDLDDDGQRSTDVTLVIESVDLDCDDSMEGSENEQPTDCDDSDPFTYQGAAPSDGTACMTDSDGDGFGDIDPVEGVTAGSDCNDNRSSIYPGAPEVVDDGIDQDCNSMETCFQDLDNDGQRSYDTELFIESSDLDCDDSGEGSKLENPTDCDDSDPYTFVGAAEFEVDNSILCMRDQDEDGFGDASLPEIIEDTANPGPFYDIIYPGTDCDDSVITTFPGAPEIIDDGVDQDCNEEELCYVDFDSDGYRNINETLTIQSTDDLDCDDDGEGSSAELATDCNDADATVYPGAFEVVADGIDQDCDSEELCFVDFDSDGYRETSLVQTIVSVDLDCSDAGEGSSSEPATDCNDNDVTVFPGASEICNGISEDCLDPNYPNSPDLERDDDLDGFVECSNFNVNTWQGDQSVIDAYNIGYGGGGDCDDSSIATYPGAAYNQSYSQCLTDQDGDGFSPDPVAYEEGCYWLVMQDSGSDGWEGFIRLNNLDSNQSLISSGLGLGPSNQSPGTFYLDNGQSEDVFYFCSEYDFSLHYSPFVNSNTTVFDSDNTFQLFHAAVKLYDSGINSTQVNEIIAIERFTPTDIADCDDTNWTVSPYIAYNEDESIHSQCLADADGDGFAAMRNCYSLELYDSAGDGWNGAAISIFSGDNSINSGLPPGQISQTANTFYLSSGYEDRFDFCVFGDDLRLLYTAGNNEFENSYQLYDSDGQEIFSDGSNPNLGISFNQDITYETSDCYDEDWMVPASFDCFLYADIPAGTFTTGPNNYSLVPMNITFAHELVSFITEIPEGVVVIDDPLGQYTNPITDSPVWISIYENGFIPNGEDMPAHSLSWIQAIFFANYMSEISGLTPCYDLLNNYVLTDQFNCEGWRLPTEFEWEYMANAGQSYLYSGSDDVADVTQSFYTSIGAGSLPNAFGLFDMSGSVWEWTNDSYMPTYSDYQSLVGYPNLINPWLSILSTNKVIRGGSFNSLSTNQLFELEVQYRSGLSLLAQNNTTGFRLVRTKF